MNGTAIASPHGTLWVRESGQPGPPLVCLHGFSLHGQMFATLAQQHELPFRILAPDLPGHGRTTVSPADLPTTVESLGMWLDRLKGRFPVLGYSQGGRIALHLARRRPDLVSRLVLVSAGTGLAEPQRTTRRMADEALAGRIESEGIARFLDAWLSHPLTGTGRLTASAAAADRRLRAENAASGLAAALRGLGQGAMDQIDPAELKIPTLWVAGALDERYAADAQVSARRAAGRAVVIDGAGHNIVAERPGEIAGIATEFLSS